MNWQSFFRFLRFHWLSHAALIASWLIPRSRKIWVVGGSKGLRFADNARHFALLARQRWPKQHIVWISADASVRNEAQLAGIPTAHPNSLQGIWLCLRASWHIFDTNFKDIHEFTGVGAKWLNLWHGIPLKSLDNIKPWQTTDLPNRLLNWWYRQTSQYQRKYLAYPTTAHFSYLSQIFELPVANIIAANLPRNQQLIAQMREMLSDKEQDAIDQLRHSGKTIVGYFPTWRDTGLDKFLGATSSTQIQQLDQLLEQHDAILITKWHSCSYQAYQHRGVSQTAATIDQTLQTSTHIRPLAFSCDLNTILPYCDILVSDYSGALIDYLLLDRPIIQMAYDLEEYQIFTGLLPDYPHFCHGAGPLETDFESFLAQLENTLRHGSQSHAAYASSRQALKHYYFPTLDTLDTLAPYLNPIKHE